MLALATRGCQWRMRNPKSRERVYSCLPLTLQACQHWAGGFAMQDAVSISLTLAAFAAALWILYFAWSRYRQLAVAMTGLKVELDSCLSLLVEAGDGEGFRESFDNID